MRAYIDCVQVKAINRKAIVVIDINASASHKESRNE